MRISLALCLPSDVKTVPVSRHLVRACLSEIGVADDCANDVEIAVSEACTNVLKHSGPGDEYELAVSIDDRMSTIRVVDTGHGFDWRSLRDTQAEPSAERGRGIELMRALVDRLSFTSVPQEGTIVNLQKELEFCDGALMRQLTRACRDGDGGGAVT